MRPLGRLFRTGWTAAAFAVALFTSACVTSVVMSAAAGFAQVDGGAMSMDGMSMDMPGMDMSGGRDTPAKGSASVCAFCSAAAHAPVLSASPPFDAPSFVAWTIAPPSETTGERGPPPFRPRARAPPFSILSST